MRSFIKKTQLRGYIIIPLVVMLFAASCSYNQEATPADVSGEDMFKAVYFAQGPVVARLETLKPIHEMVEENLKHNGNQTEYEAFTDELMAEIRNIDPQYFDNFKRQLMSDNHYAIEQALNNGWKMSSAAGYRTTYAEVFRLADEIEQKNVDFTSEKLKSLDLTKGEDIETFKRILASDYSISLETKNFDAAGRGKCVAITFFIAGNVAVVVNLAYAYNVARTQNFAWTENYTVQPPGPKTQASESLVSEIAEKF